jgi:hypothetical protein
MVRGVFSRNNFSAGITPFSELSFASPTRSAPQALLLHQCPVAVADRFGLTGAPVFSSALESRDSDHVTHANKDIIFTVDNVRDLKELANRLHGFGYHVMLASTSLDVSCSQSACVIKVCPLAKLIGIGDGSLISAFFRVDRCHLTKSCNSSWNCFSSRWNIRCEVPTSRTFAAWIRSSYTSNGGRVMTEANSRR